MTTQEILQGVHDWTNGKIVYDISVAHPDGQGNPTKYATLAAALGANGANVPQSLRKGGMSVKFVQSSDHKYVQFRCIADEFTTDTTQWQGVDEKPVVGSKNLVESGGVAGEIQKIYSHLKMISVLNLQPGYYKIPEVGNTASLDVISTPYYGHQQLECSEGDIFEVQGNYKTDSPAVTCFAVLDENNVVLKRVNGAATMKTFVVPANAVKALYTSQLSFDNILNYGSADYLEKQISSKLDKSIFDKLHGEDCNLFDEKTMVVKGQYINASGNIVSAAGWAVSTYVPVVAGLNYYLTAEHIGREVGLTWYNSSKTKISGGNTYIFNSILSAPENAAYVRFNCGANNDKSYGIMMVQSSEPAPQYQTPYVIPIDAVKGLQKEIDDNYNSLDKRLNGLRCATSNNIFDENTMVVNGKYVSSDGNIRSAVGWAVTDYIPITAGNNYYITAEFKARKTGLSWFNASKQKISGGNNQIFDIPLTAPENAAYLVFNMAENNTYSKGVMVTVGTSGKTYETPYVIPISAVKNLQDLLNELQDRKLTISKNGNYYKCSTEKGYIQFEKRGTNHSGNPLLNFYNWKIGEYTGTNNDDIAPAHILNNTIGANHGLPCSKVNIPSHGFDNTIIGTEWLHTNGKKYYPALIIDANNILFISENTGSLSSPVFSIMGNGTLTYNGQSYSVSSVTEQQLYPSIKEYNLSVYADQELIGEDGQTYCNVCQLVESYEIINPASVLVNLISRAGQSSEPSFDGDSVVKVENIYRVDSELNVIVISNFVVLDTIAFSDIMFAQAINIGSNGQTKYYIPNSKPWGSVDLRTPQSVQWSASTPAILTDIAHTDDTQKPINRVVQYRDSIGFALGFVPTLGVGSNLALNTSTTFEVRNNTGKVYPHGVDSNKLGTTLSAGDMFTGVLYRCFFDVSNESNRQSMYHFNLNNIEYIYVDYKGSILDNVIIDNSLNGKKVEILEAINVELKTDVYNNGFYLNADYVEGKTCYAVLKVI